MRSHSDFAFFPQRLRVIIFSRCNVVIKRTAIICGQCVARTDRELVSIMKETQNGIRDCNDDEPGHEWWKRYNAPVKNLTYQSEHVSKLSLENTKLKKNQKDRFDTQNKYRRVNVDLTNVNAFAKYMKMKLESETKYCSDNVLIVNDRIRQRTNRKQNFI